MERVDEQLFFDPFAEAGEEPFDVVLSFQTIFERYENKEIEHDYTADKFVADTEALMLDAQFAGQFQQAQAIAMRMHELCMDDHVLQTSMSTSELFGQSQVGHDSHQHDETAAHKKSEKKNTGKKDKKLSPGWLAALWTAMQKPKAKKTPSLFSGR